MPVWNYEQIYTYNATLERFLTPFCGVLMLSNDENHGGPTTTATSLFLLCVLTPYNRSSKEV